MASSPNLVPDPPHTPKMAPPQCKDCLAPCGNPSFSIKGISYGDSQGGQGQGVLPCFAGGLDPAWPVHGDPIAPPIPWRLLKLLSQTPGLALKRSARKPPFSGLYQLQCNISAPPSMTFQFSILETLQPSLLRPWEIVMAIFHPKSGLLESSPAQSPVFCCDCIASHYIQSPAAIHQGPDSNILYILISGFLGQETNP